MIKGNGQAKTKEIKFKKIRMLFWKVCVFFCWYLEEYNIGKMMKRKLDQYKNGKAFTFFGII